MELKNATALISGGASGLGAATARTFAAAGANIVILDLDTERAERLVAELGAQARFAQANVTDEEQVSAAVELAKAEFGALHININCAGIVTALRTLSKHGAHPLDLFKSVIEINLIGTFNVLRLAAAAMATNPPNAEGERGVIINTASVAA
ncbi:MAG: SDR family NAD(P)-dependent oxidoreductase, partial [Chloroflexota bacterium]|nr:SDR family NAD(P)-dependent oxidoreductase [Chloroflexota bacterium]